METLLKRKGEHRSQKKECSRRFSKEMSDLSQCGTAGAKLGREVMDSGTKGWNGRRILRTLRMKKEMSFS